MTFRIFPVPSPDRIFPLASEGHIAPLPFEESVSLPVPIPYGSQRILTVNVRCEMRGDLKLIRECRSPHVQHAWRIPLGTLTVDDVEFLDICFAAKRGSLIPFQATDPWDLIIYTVRLASDDWAAQEADPTRWGSNYDLIEVADFKPLKSAAMEFPALSTGAIVQLPYSFGRRYRTIIVQQEDFSERRWESFADALGIMRWAVGGDLMTDAEAATLLNFWEACLGPYRQFPFTDPKTSAIYAAHFVESSIVHTPIEYNCNSLRMTVEQLK